MGKNKGPKAGAPGNVITLIDNEASLRDIVNEAVKGRVIPRDDIKMPKDQLSRVMQGEAGVVHHGTRATVIGQIRAKAEGWHNKR